MILDNYVNEDLYKYSRFLKANDIGIGAIEYVQNESGERIVYDVNTNTNYNSGAEAKFGDKINGMFEIAKFLGRELRKQIKRRSEEAVLELS